MSEMVTFYGCSTAGGKPTVYIGSASRLAMVAPYLGCLLGEPSDTGAPMERPVATARENPNREAAKAAARARLQAAMSDTEFLARHDAASNAVLAILIEETRTRAPKPHG